MKHLIFALAFIATMLNGVAETFVGSTSATNRLVVGTNEAIIIHGFGLSGGIPNGFQLIKDGVTNSFVTAGSCSLSSPSAVAGPCEFTFNKSAFMSFRRIPTSALQTVVFAPNATSAVVSVPSGRTILIFNPLNSTSFGISATVSRGTNSAVLTVGGSVGNVEISGPADLTFSGQSSSDPNVVSFVLTEEAQIVPQGLTVQAPSGGFHLEVEKSANLTNWAPVVIQNLKGDQKAYYRLRITK
jgi:hypothetical protein